MTTAQAAASFTVAPVANRASTSTKHSIPTRFCADLLAAKETAGKLRWFISGYPEPSQSEWRDLAATLTQGDPLADDLVSWMQEAGMKESRAAFDQALEQGADSIVEAESPLGAFFNFVNRDPEWLDRERVEAGMRVVRATGKNGMRVLRDFGLMAGYQASAINQTLVMTGALEKGAQRRVAETTKWWMDCNQAGGLESGAAGFNTTLRVRLIHAMVRSGLSQRPDWESEKFGRPINQCDMQVTYLAFSVMFLLGQRLMGGVITEREGSDVMHAWKYLGWLMGVDASLIADTEQQGRRLLYHNLISQAQADQSSVKLARALMDEPLTRHYPRFHRLNALWNKYTHLSIVSFFIGPSGVKKLGLPRTSLPWYVVLSWLPRLAYTSLGFLPGGKAWLFRRGERAQQRELKILFGESVPEIVGRPNVN